MPTNRGVVEVKKWFFDRQKVKRLMDRKTIQAQKRMGGLVRITAKRSMKSRKGPSAPGNPPHKHNRKQLDRLLFYSYDPKTKSVYVGPTLLQGYERKGVPKLMEKGGSRIDYDKRTGKPIRRDFPQRAFMVPALMEHTSKYARFVATSG